MMHKISGADDHISFNAVGLIDDITDKGLRDQTVVQVSKVNNGETIELREGSELESDIGSPEPDNAQRIP